MAGRSSRAFIRKRKAPRRPPVRAGGWGWVPSLSCRRSCLLLSLLLFPAPLSSGFPVRAPSRPLPWRRVWPRSRPRRACSSVARPALMRLFARPLRRPGCVCFPSRRLPGRAAFRAVRLRRALSRSCARWAAWARRSSRSRRARVPLVWRLLPLLLLVSVARVPVPGLLWLLRRAVACRVSSRCRPAWLFRPAGAFRRWAPLAARPGSLSRRPFRCRSFSWARHWAGTRHGAFGAAPSP